MHACVPCRESHCDVVKSTEPKDQKAQTLGPYQTLWPWGRPTQDHSHWLVCSLSSKPVRTQNLAPFLRARILKCYCFHLVPWPWLLSVLTHIQLFPQCPTFIYNLIFFPRPDLLWGLVHVWIPSSNSTHHYLLPTSSH